MQTIYGGLKSLLENRNLSVIIIMVMGLVLQGCRDRDIPEDIHEHEEIELITLTVTEQGNPSQQQEIKYIGGVASEKLLLEPGKSYLASLDFFHGHDDHYHSMLEEIIEERDEHFIVYELAGIEAKFERTLDDMTRSDGNKLGLSARITVESVASPAAINIKLIHAPSRVNMNYPSNEKQLGEVTGGEADVNMTIPVN